MGSVIQINKKFYEIEEVFADKQVVDGLIKDFAKVFNTQNNLIDKLKKWETQITNNFNSLGKQVIKNKENKERIDFATEEFIKLIKVEKNTKINNANIHLLEMRLDNIQNNLIKRLSLIEKEK